MTNTTVRVLWGSFFGVYTTISIFAYGFEIKPFLFFLALPWSVIAAVFSPLIGHALGYRALTHSLLVCTIINSIVLAIQVVKPRRTKDERLT